MEPKWEGLKRRGPGLPPTLKADSTGIVEVQVAALGNEAGVEFPITFVELQVSLDTIQIKSGFGRAQAKVYATILDFQIWERRGGKEGRASATGSQSWHAAMGAIEQAGEVPVSSGVS